MNANVGGADRIARFIIGPAAIAAGLYIKDKRWKTAAIAFGVAELLTATMRYCPVNAALGINTAKQDAIDEAMSEPDVIETEGTALTETSLAQEPLVE
jgi:hypothetical protein